MSKFGTFITNMKLPIEGLLVLLTFAVSDALISLAGQQVTLALVVNAVQGAVISTLTSYYRAQRATLPSLSALESELVKPVESGTSTEGK